MLTLALDCSTLEGSVALVDGPFTYFNQSWRRQRSHGELLSLTLERAFELSGKKLSDVELFAVGHGPGSFTGIRVAVNAARALAYSENKPVMAFSTMEILAQAVPLRKQKMITMLNAYDNHIFASVFTPGKAQWLTRGSPKAWSLDDFEKLVKTPHLCVGEGYLDLNAVFSNRLKSRLIRDESLLDFPSAVALARLAERKFRPSKALVWKDVQAVYIRASGAEEKLRRGALKPLPNRLF